MKYAIRSSTGCLTCLVSQGMRNALVRRYLGEYRTVGDKEVYLFRENVAYGNADISVIAFSGSFIELDLY